MAKLQRTLRTSADKEKLRGRDRCASRHPGWHSVRCERMDSDHVVHNADGERFEWVQFMPVPTLREYRG